MVLKAGNLGLRYFAVDTELYIHVAQCRSQTIRHSNGGSGEGEEGIIGRGGAISIPRLAQHSRHPLVQGLQAAGAPQVRPPKRRSARRPPPRQGGLCRSTRPPSQRNPLLCRRLPHNLQNHQIALNLFPLRLPSLRFRHQCLCQPAPSRRAAKRRPWRPSSCSQAAAAEINPGTATATAMGRHPKAEIRGRARELGTRTGDQTVPAARDIATPARVPETGRHNLGYHRQQVPCQPVRPVAVQLEVGIPEELQGTTRTTLPVVAWHLGQSPV
jgi:hypothetical protein